MVNYVIFRFEEFCKRSVSKIKPIENYKLNKMKTLPDELISHILSFINTKQFLNILLISKYFLKIGLKPESMNQKVTSSKNGFFLTKEMRKLEIEQLIAMKFNIEVQIIQQKLTKIFQNVVKQEKLKFFFNTTKFIKLSFSIALEDYVLENIFIISIFNVKYTFSLRKYLLILSNGFSIHNQETMICNFSPQSLHNDDQYSNDEFNLLWSKKLGTSKEETFLMIFLILCDFQKKCFQEMLMIDLNDQFFSESNLNKRKIREIIQQITL
jgi:hypothetical protein